MTDSVAVDAKRILLRYGAPIAILDKVSESHRIEFAREIAKTVLPERERRLRQLLADRGYIDPDAVRNAKGRARKAKPSASASTSAPETPAGGGARTEVPAGTRAGKVAKAKAAKAEKPKPAERGARPKAKAKSPKKTPAAAAKKTAKKTAKKNPKKNPKKKTAKNKNKK